MRVLSDRPPGDIVHGVRAAAKTCIIKYVQLKTLESYEPSSKAGAEARRLMHKGRSRIVPTGDWAYYSTLISLRLSAWFWGEERASRYSLGLPEKLSSISGALGVERNYAAHLSTLQQNLINLRALETRLRLDTDHWPDTIRVFQIEPEVHVAEAAPEQARRFVELVRGIPAVQHVAFMHDGEVFVLWSLTRTYDMDANDEIYSRELTLCDEWPDVVYDFHVRPLEGRDVETVLPDGFDVVWSRSE